MTVGYSYTDKGPFAAGESDSLGKGQSAAQQFADFSNWIVTTGRATNYGNATQGDKGQTGPVQTANDEKAENAPSFLDAMTGTSTGSPTYTQRAPGVSVGGSGLPAWWPLAAGGVVLLVVVAAMRKAGKL